MKIIVSEKAQKWIENEMLIPEGEGIRFFGKYGGSTDVHTGFSQGLSVALPDNPMADLKQGPIYFFIEANDDWFFNGYDLSVDFDTQLDEPVYSYIPNE